ncbi:MAG: SiaC family regulatory phosphoprotein [Bacteroidales bacterium]
MILMTDSANILEYRGQIDYKIIDNLLKKLKKSREYLQLDRTTGKRLYSILVECLENSAKYSDNTITGSHEYLPYISVTKTENDITIESGNTIRKEDSDIIAEKIDLVNGRDEKPLTELYESIINKDTGKNSNNAGLGFLLMKLKSGNDLNYRFISINRDLAFFELKINLKKYIMRKLVIDQTPSSPRVVLDPEKRYFEISGESRPPDVGTFYGEIITWMDDYSGHLLKTQESREPVVFNFDFEYFNSSSAKYILDFCKQIASVRSHGKDIAVNWYYEEDDIDMLEVGREMSRISKLPFQFVKKG